MRDLLLCALTAFAEPMTKGERERLISHLEMTTGWLQDEVEGLSDAQLNFKQKPDAWSVLMVVEHLTIAEPQCWQWLQDALKQPATDKPAEAKDGDILWYGIDRTQLSRTAEAREAKGEMTDVRKGLAEFSKLGAGSYHR